MTKQPKLPTVIYPGGLSPREHALKEARDWQIEVAPTFVNGVQSREYNIVCDLIAALLAAPKEKNR